MCPIDCFECDDRQGLSMNLQDLRYFAAVAEYEHFGRAADSCHVSQPTLSGQIRKLEEHLGVTLFERTNKRVALTPVGTRLLIHARRALEEASLLESAAKASRGQLNGPLRLGAIPTLAPYLMPLILKPLREAHPNMPIELWEDLTDSLLARLRAYELDAALIATDPAEGDLVSRPLFDERFLAALPRSHPLAESARVSETELGRDVLVLAEGHCLASQTLEACGRADRGSLRAASLETLVNLVGAGYGTTLVPALAAPWLQPREVAVRPLEGGAHRTVRLVARSSFPRPKALDAVERVVRKTVQPALSAG